MILAFNRLINTNNATSNNPGKSNTNGQMAYHGSTSDGVGYPKEEGGDKSNIIHRLRNTLQSKPVDIIFFVSAYLAIWALIGVVLLVGWSFFFDTLLLQLERNDNQAQQLISANIIYGIVLIVAGTYQFSLLKKVSCLGYCEFPLSLPYETTAKRQIRSIEDGNVSRSLLSWLLLALFSTYGSVRMDEFFLDGIICCLLYLLKRFGPERWALD